jgi:tetratricopeptide (TPR) repeat protein
MLGRLKNVPLTLMTRSLFYPNHIGNYWKHLSSAHWRSLSSITVEQTGNQQAKPDLAKKLPKRLSADARKILQHCAYLDANMIPIELLKKIIPEPESLYYALHELKQVPPVLREDKSGLYSLNKELQESLKDKEKQNVIIEALLKEIVSIFPRKNKPKWVMACAKTIAEAAMNAAAAQETSPLLNLEQLCNMLGDYYRHAQQHKEALRYYERALAMVRARVSYDHLVIVNSLNTVGLAHMAFEDELNHQASLGYFYEAYKMIQVLGWENHPNSITTLNNLGAAYAVLGGQDNILKSIECHQKVIAMRPLLNSTNHPNIASALNNLGTAYANLSGKANLRQGIIYLEQSLHIYKVLYPYNHPDIARSLSNLAASYEDLGDKYKALEYYKQAYGVWHALEGENHKETVLAKQYIIVLQPEFFSRQGFVQKLQERQAQGGNPVGSESRKLILSHSAEKSDKLLLIKQRIQKAVLDKIAEDCHYLGWHAIGWFGGYGVQTYLKPAFLERKLGDLGRDPINIELAQMLCFESINLGIMHSNKRPYCVAESFCRTHSRLVKKLVTEYPEFFVDGSIIEACMKALPKEPEFADLLQGKVKYMAGVRDEVREVEIFR